MKIQNEENIDLSLAVWLVHDEYDYIDKPNYISVTSLLKPIRQIVLSSRVSYEDKVVDVSEYASRALGNSIHSAVENAWNTGYINSLRKLGYPESIISRVLINPTPEQLSEVEKPYPIYMEQRSFKDIAGYTVGGKFDFIENGVLKDFKSTSVYTWLKGSRTEEHKLQGSLYKWLDPRITSDYIRINYIFTDWQKGMKASNPDYPNRLEYKDIPLMTNEETEQWVLDRLSLVKRYKDMPETKLPECTPEELWMSEPMYKYYANAAKTDGRSTKNFTSLAEANAFMASKGGVGIVKTIPGEPKRCAYCPVFDICTQKDRYINV